jgi:serine/threonine protein kinase
MMRKKIQLRLIRVINMGLCGSKAVESNEKPLLTKRHPTLSSILSTKQVNIKSMFKNERLIGKGTYSSVYLVEKKDTKEKRALKEIRKSALKDHVKETILNEIMILQKLVIPTQSHPNIVKIYEVINSHSFFYIVSEYLEGGELFEKLISPHFEFEFTEEKACRWFFDIVRAIKYCHKNGIIHRDLKPENIMFDKDDDDAVVKLIDFGTSVQMSADESNYKTEAAGTVWAI